MKHEQVLSHQEKELCDQQEMKLSESNGENSATDHEESSPTVPNMPEPGCNSERGMKKRQREDGKVMCAILFKVLKHCVVSFI